MQRSATECAEALYGRFEDPEEVAKTYPAEVLAYLKEHGIDLQAHIEKIKTTQASWRKWKEEERLSKEPRSVKSRREIMGRTPQPED